ncbi:class I SAM-dependent methyltransferase [bacterium]|nr:class I SAM-dependent methyltransferase [candidate division CSSED10-310 bacterium]
MTQAQNAFDDRFFELYMDPMLHRVREIVARCIPPDSTVIDIGCGTGEQCARLASSCRRIVGIDPDSKRIDEARARVAECRGSDAVIIHGDFRTLNRFDDETFDIALMVMRIHELDTEERLPVLRDVFRIGRRVILSDYVCPSPDTPHGAVARMCEMLTGIHHFDKYQLYHRAGGLRSIERQLKVVPQHVETNQSGTIEVCLYTGKR